ncbi:Mom family adenine methylcarbamoylation protein [Streptomyces nigrescens]|uniref:Mom family adenine methylcarbamoylation protein n=1 Tax=Streptomyces nigrescens TaxID=1920 RepID=UPI00370008AB
MTNLFQEPLPFSDLAEIPTASEWCQRWRGRRHSWRHRRDGGFDHRRFEVDLLDETRAKDFVLAHHYSRSFPAARFRLGLYTVDADERRLSGVAVFGVPVSSAVLTRPLPDLEPYVASLECSRFVLTDECPANSESWFLARCFEALLTRGVRGVVSFADPVPRRDAAGRVTALGHVGTIYAASNALYMGRATPRTIKVLPDGTILNERAAQKIRRREQGHEYAEKALISLGAPAPRPSEDPAVWLQRALASVGARTVRHRGAHRYVFRLGKDRRARESIRLGMPALGVFPKRPDPE